MQTTQYFNPQDAAREIMLKSFLRSRSSLREQGCGSRNFQDNRIRSCSFVKEGKDGIKAVPFYDKRSQTSYPTKSQFSNSWMSSVHKRPQTVNAGMGRQKPLIAYNPNSSRSLLSVPDFLPPHPNSSRIEIGKRNKRDCKHYVTNYGNANSFLHESIRLPSNNPAIQAFRHKWIKSRLDQ